MLENITLSADERLIRKIGKVRLRIRIAISEHELYLDECDVQYCCRLFHAAVQSEQRRIQAFRTLQHIGIVSVDITAVADFRGTEQAQG